MFNKLGRTTDQRSNDPSPTTIQPDPTLKNSKCFVEIKGLYSSLQSVRPNLYLKIYSFIFIWDASHDLLTVRPESDKRQKRGATNLETLCCNSCPRNREEQSEEITTNESSLSRSTINAQSINALSINQNAAFRQHDKHARREC